MAILGVDDFKSKLVGGGARSNLFKATVNYPAYAAGDVELTSFMCKSAQMPASQIEAITVPFRGRQLQIAGDRTFEPWTITIINDTDFAIRNAFERWMNGINGHSENTGLTNPTDYKADLIIEQLDKSGVAVKRYDFRGTFPTSVSAIDVSYDTENEIEEFEVELQVDYWESGTTS
jgi:hypothetical protein